MRLFQDKTLKKVCRNGLLLGAALISVWGLSQIQENRAYAAESANDETTMYQQGAFFVPEENVQIQVEEETFVDATKGVVKFPDGKAYELGGLTLNQKGVYEVFYYGEYNGEKISSSKQFVVTDAAGSVDIVKPKIEIMDIGTKTAFNVVLNEEITIKDVEVTDDTYYGNAKVAVYFNYGTAEQSSVYFENGKFTPKEVGAYSVVYTVTDGYGNVTEKVLKYTAKSDLTKKFTYTEPEKPQGLVAGQECKLDRLKGTGNSNGLVNSEIAITNPLGETEIVKNKAATFVPNVLGEYIISYTLRDYVYEETFSYTLICKDTEKLVLFEDTIILPRYFIKGATYSLDEYLAYKPTMEGLKGYTTEIYVKEDGVEEYVKVENPVAYKVTASESLQFKYVCDGKFIESEVIPVQANVGYGTNEINYLNYFVGDYNLAQATMSSFAFTFDGAKDTGKMSFINPIAFPSFNIAFQVAEAQGNFDAITFILTDYANPENVNTVTFTKESDGLSLKVNGGTAVKITNKAFVGESFGFWINATEKSFGTNLTDDAGKELKFNYNVFESYLCHLEIQLSGISGESRVDISKINNQGLKANLVVQNPEISASIFKGTVVVGSEIAIAPMEFSSVFYPAVVKDGTVTVTDPNGAVLTATDGTVLKNVIANREYIVKLTISGSYLVKYTAEVEVNGSVYKRTSSGALNAYDNVAPTVTFDNGANPNSVVELKVGQLHTVFKYKATDNLTASKDMQTTMVVYNEDGWVVDACENEFAFNRAGTYRIVIYAVDDDGNVGKNSYTVVVR